MGGYGSGTKWDKKGAVEDHPRVDVRVLHREHGIKPGSQITVQYEWRGEQVAQEIFLDWTPCNYGGLRPWFSCMNCGRRVAVLYLRGKYFACRHCHDLTYLSCQESDSRFSKLFRNYDAYGGAEDLPLYALKGWLSRAQRGKEKLKREMNRRRQGRPQKRPHGPHGDLH
jgi:hypothetical protein